MDDAAKAKARKTRIENQTARIARREAEAKLKQAEKKALQRVFEDESATSEQVLEAARLLEEIEKY